MKKLFHIVFSWSTAIIMVFSIPSCSTRDIRDEYCDFYLAYEYAYKLNDPCSTDSIPQIFGFELTKDENGDDQVVLKYADGSRETTPLKYLITPEMLNSPEIRALLSDAKISLFDNSPSTLIIQLKNGNALLYDVEKWKCDYFYNGTLIRYPADVRRTIISIRNTERNKEKSITKN